MIQLKKNLNIPNLNKNNECNFNNFYTNDKKLSIYMYISCNNNKKYIINNNKPDNINLNLQRKKLTTLPISNINNSFTREKLEEDSWKECLKITSENKEIIDKFSNLLNTNSSKQINLIIKLIEKLHEELKKNEIYKNQYKLELTWDNIHMNNGNNNITIVSNYQINDKLFRYLDDDDKNLIKK